MKETEHLHCSFCGKPEEMTKRLIAGPNGVYICNECVEVCRDVIKEESEKSKDKENVKLLKPSEIKDKLDEFIVGQEQAKKVLSVAVYNHYKRINATIDDNGLEIDKSNILVLGPTGSGKTLLARTLAKVLDVPFAVADATTLTEAGYVGEDVENILLRLIQAADFDVEKAEKGIIYIDEIDKIASGGKGHGPDVSREGVQRDILPIVEGCTVQTKHGTIRTDFILFVAAGAFHISKMEDLIPELQGRFPIRVELNNLTEADFVRILREPDNAVLKQYKALLGVDGVELNFTDDAIDEIAKVAFIENENNENLGARRLHAVMEHLLKDVLYEADDNETKQINVDKAFVDEHIGSALRETNLKRYII